MGVYGHGCGHLYLALKGKTDETTPSERAGGDPKKHALVFGILFFFWFSLTYGVKDQTGAVGHLMMALSYVGFHYFYVPGTIAFTYVQAVLIVTGAVSALTLKEKGKYYNVASILIFGPIAMMAWAEGFLCEKFFVHIGGHLWYDMVIPISYTIFFFYVRNIELGNSASKVKAE